MARFCEYCGSKNEENSAFCSQCGKELRNMEKAPPTQKPVPVSEEPAYAEPVQRTPVYSEPVSQASAYYAKNQGPRRSGNTGLIIGIAALVIVAAAVVLILVLKPFGGSGNISESLIDPYTVFAEVGDDYMALLPEKPGPIVPGEPLPTAAPYEPGPQINSGTYFCNYLAFSMEPYAGWDPDESSLYSDYMVTFKKDDYSVLSVLYSPDYYTTDYFEWDYQAFVDDYAVAAGSTSGEVTDQGWTTTAQGYETFYFFYTAYSGSTEDTYNYTFVINSSSTESYIITFAQSADSATEQDIDEAFGMIDTFRME